MRWKRKGEHTCMDQEGDTCKVQMEMQSLERAEIGSLL